MSGLGLKELWKKRRSCPKGMGRSCAQLCWLFGFLLFFSWGASVNAAPVDAKKRLKAQCDLGSDDGLSCWELGNLYFERSMWREAQKYFEEACKHRWYSGCHNGGVAAQRLGDFESAKRLWRRACTHNHLASCSALAFILWREKDVVHAKNLSQKACVEHGEACYLRGTIAMSRDGGPSGPNKEEALVWFKKGCDREYLMSCYRGGVLSQELHHSTDEAVLLYKRACDLAHARSCVNLGEIYVFEGRVQEARAVLRDVCQFQASGEACVALGGLEEKAGNVYAAAKAYKVACDMLYQSACYSWAQLEFSRGNVSRASRLLKKACDGGYQQACREIKRRKDVGQLESWGRKRPPELSAQPTSEHTDVEGK